MSGAPGMFGDNLRFETIVLQRHAAVCVAFRRDSFVCSFGSDEGFVRENGPDGARYLAWLKSRIEDQPHGHVHVWCEGSIVGQIEMRVLPGLPISGYVNLFYLLPEMRGCGASSALQRYALQFFRQGRADVARLRVSPTNHRALAYYRKHGWQDLGLDLHRGNVHEMELDLTRADPGAASIKSAS
jgi:ribosomal protein S18 acetylase RimI-like enzyme